MKYAISHTRSFQLHVFLVITFFFVSCKKEAPAGPPAGYSSDNSSAMSNLMLTKSFSVQKKFTVKIRQTESNTSLNSDEISGESDSLTLVQEGEYFFQDIETGHVTRNQKIGDKPFIGFEAPDRIDFAPNEIRSGNRKLSSDDKQLKTYKEFLERIRKDKGEADKNRSKEKIEWTKMSSAAIIKYFKDKGKEVVALGNNRYEISGDYTRNGLNKQISMKMIFNASLPGFERSEMYIDGKKYSEMVSLTDASGTRRSSMKFYGGTIGNKPRNFLLTQTLSNEFKGGKLP